MVNKISKRILITIIALTSFLLGTVSAYAYGIKYSGGFTPTPTTIHCYSGLSSYTKTEVSSACTDWNVAGGGMIVTKGSDHTNTTFPNKNGSNQITQGARGTNEYLMRTMVVNTAYFWTCIEECDIDINTSHPWAHDGSSTSYDVWSAMAHELGHLAGLDESYEDDATMYFEMSKGETKKRTIEDDDRNGIDEIYN